LFWILVAGVAVRAAMTIGISPAILSYPDTWGYVSNASGELIPTGGFRPHGYPMILRALHGLGIGLRGAIFVQHLMGLATAALVYGTVRRAGGARWAASIPAAFIAVSIDFQYFEHTLLGETSFVFLFYAGIYALVRGMFTDRNATVWIAAGGGALGLAAWIRQPAIFVVVAIAVLLMVERGMPLRHRLRRSGALLAAGVLGLVGFLGARALGGEGFTTLPGNGWALYSRAAPFADCTRFDPPEGTDVLCEDSPPGDRYGPDFYGWSNDSPGRRHFIGTPLNDEVVGAFARAAVAAQPGDLVRAIVRDLGRVVGFTGPKRPGFGPGWDALSIDSRDATIEELNHSVAEPYYGDYEIHVGAPTSVLASLQDRLRPPEPLNGVMLLVVLGGLAVLPDRRMAIAVLATASVVFIGSQVALVFNPRYILPGLPALVMAAALAADGLLTRLRQRPAEIQSQAPSPEEGVDPAATTSMPHTAGAGRR
jgi:hypothetical protein